MRKQTYKKRSQRIRRKLKKVNTERYRLSIYRSSRSVSAQIIDDKNNKTLVSASSYEKDQNNKVKKIDLSAQIADLLAKRALEKKITKVFFDRGKHRYHGIIKVFAETLRKKGLNF